MARLSIVTVCQSMAATVVYAVVANVAIVGHFVRKRCGSIVLGVELRADRWSMIVQRFKCHATAVGNQ